MGRILRADEIPSSALRVGSRITFEDFDDGGNRGDAGNVGRRTAAEQSQSALAENIIKAAEFQAEELINRAKRQAEKQLEIAHAELNRAKAEAERILVDAKTESAQLRERVLQEAHQQGYEKGQTLAITERNAEIDQILATLQRGLDGIPKFRQKLIAQSEAEVLELILVIATKVVGFELSIRPELILEVVQAGINLLKDKHEITLRLSPTDFERVKVYRPQLLAQIDGARNIYLQADENLITGECLIENKSNLIDSTWRRKISNAAEMVWELYNQRTTASQEHADATPD